MDAIECMKSRRSIRAYRTDSVPEEIIRDIVDCGRSAASAINLQPCHFVVVTDKAMRTEIADATDHGRFIADAPVCILVFCEGVKYFLEDGSAATQNLLNAAKAHDLGSCWIAGHNKDYADRFAEMLDVPKEHKLVSLVALGYPAEERHASKKPLSDVLHWGHFVK